MNAVWNIKSVVSPPLVKVFPILILRMWRMEVLEMPLVTILEQLTSEMRSFINIPKQQSKSKAAECILLLKLLYVSYTWCELCLTFGPNVLFGFFLSPTVGWPWRSVTESCTIWTGIWSMSTKSARTTTTHCWRASSLSTRPYRGLVDSEVSCVKWQDCICEDASLCVEEGEDNHCYN